MDAYRMIAVFLLGAVLGCSSERADRRNITEDSAKQALVDNLDDWIGGKAYSQAVPIALAVRGVLPTKYEIQTWVLTQQEPDPTAISVYGPQKPDTPVYRAVVELEFISESNQPLTKVLEYRVYFAIPQKDMALELYPDGRWTVHASDT